MRLSKYFTLSEMERSLTAKQYGIVNRVTEAHEKANLTALCENVLDPIRDMVGGPVTVTSGYRSPGLNKKIGGAKNSQHTTGQAADIVADTDLYGLAQAIAGSDLPFDQLIFENSQRKSGDWTVWLHISHCRHGDNRREVMTMCKRQGGGRHYSFGLYDPKTEKKD